MGVLNGSLIKVTASGKITFLCYTSLVSEMGTVQDEKMSYSKVCHVGEDLSSDPQDLCQTRQSGVPGTP